MRELRFRAWDKEIGGMYMVTTLQFHACGQINAWAFYPDAVKPKARTYGHNPILMQYTGIKDKNGKDIYEGDILLYGTQIVTVAFNDEIGCFVMKGLEEWDCTFPRLEYRPPAFEVIGNIYENPELKEQ